MANNYGNILSQSTNPLAFTTNGQDTQNSQPTVIKSNESSLRVEYDNDLAKSYLTYACNFTQPSTGTHTLDWTFTPNHNTKGYIKNEGVKLNVLGRLTSNPNSGSAEFEQGIDYPYQNYGLEKGRGLTSSNPMPVEGGLIAVTVTGISYDCAKGNTTDRLVGTNVYYKFPSNPLLDEDGTNDKEILLYSFIGQSYTNIHSPNYRLGFISNSDFLHSYGFSAESGHQGKKDLYDFIDLDVTGPIDYYPYNENTPKKLAYSGSNYAYIDSNIGIAKKGTCAGLFSSSVSPNTAPSYVGANTSIKCVSTNLNISKADNSQAKTDPRRALLKIYRGWSENVSLDAYEFASFNDGSEIYDEVAIYQAGGNLTTPDPTIDITLDYDSVADKVNAGNWGTMGLGLLTSGDHGYYALNYRWKSNEGTRARVSGDLTTIPSRLTQQDTEVTEEDSGTHYIIKCPDNTGTDIEIEIDGYSFNAPENTKQRSIKGKFLIECINDDKGSAGSLSNELNDSSRNPKRKVPFTITQLGKTNPNPSFTIRQKLSHYSTNEDTSIYPTLTFDGMTVKGQYEQTWTINTEGKKTLTIHVPSTRPSVQGATLKEKTIVLGGNNELSNISSNGGTVAIPITWNYVCDDFQKGYIPNSGDYKWVTYFPDINAATGIDDDLGNTTSVFDIYQPGNNNIYTGAYPSVTITMTGVYGKDGTAAKGKCYATGHTKNTVTASVTRNDQMLLTTTQSFTFEADSNGASISSVSGIYSNDILTINHNGVSSADKEGYVNFKVSTGKLQYPNQTETIDDTLGLYYRIKGEGYGGKIQITTSKVSGEGGSVNKVADIDLSDVPTSGKSYNITDLVKRNDDFGYVDGSTFKVPSTVTVPADVSSYKVVCTPVKSVQGGSSTWNVYGTIIGTANSSLNNTALHGTGFSNSNNGLICQISTIGGMTVPNSSYYKFWWTPAINGVSMTSSGSTATIAGFATNLGGNNAIASKTEYMGDGYWVKVTGGQSASTQPRKLGTLSAGWNTTTPTSSVDVWQSGAGGGAIANSDTFTFNFYNFIGHLSTDTNTGLSSSSVKLSSSGPNDPQSVNGIIDSTNWDCYSIPYFIPRFTSNFNITNTSNVTKSIGAFDDDIDEYIGIDTSDMDFKLYYFKVVKISNSTYSNYYSLGTETINIRESQLSKIELTWSDGVTTGKTRHIQISASNPGTYTYTCTAINIEYTFTNKYDGKSVTLNDGVHNGTDCSHTPITWTYKVDSKHYYNS